MKKVNDLAQIRKYLPDEAVVKKVNVTALSAMITAGICLASYPTYASDIEIYKVPEESVGATTILLMLDTSGSMDWEMGGGNRSKRLSVLKQGLRDLLNGTATIPRVEDKIVMGLADFGGANGRILAEARPLGDIIRTEHYDIKKPLWMKYSKTTGWFWQTTTTIYYVTCLSHDTNNKNCLSWSGESTTAPKNYTDASPYKYDVNSSCTYGNNGDCRYIYEAFPQEKTYTHRDYLLSKTESLTANGGTPTPYAYAEAAAYLMGQRTNTKRELYFAQIGSNSYKKCNSWDEGGTCLEWLPVNSWLTGTEYNSYTRAHSGTQGGYSGYYYMNDNSASGFTSSIDTVKNGNYYIAPTSITEQLTNNDKKSCSGQGIYFLTDGEPEPSGIKPGADGRSGTAYNLMNQVLKGNNQQFSCAGSKLGNLSGYKNTNNAWSCVGNFAESLLNPNANPVGLQIKTAVVGFSSGFSSNSNVDVQDARKWGEIGGGGSYIGTDSNSVVTSINKFIQEINKDIPSMSTGSSVIPEDALNPMIIQGYAYFPQFEPKVNDADTQQIWFGNLKKYYVVDNGVYATPVASEANLVVQNGALKDKADIWKSLIQYTENDPVYAKHGVRGQLLLGRNQTETQRKLLTDYKFDVDSVTKDMGLVQIPYTYTTDQKTKKDITFSRQLMSLLGYDINANEVIDADLNGFDLSNESADLRQMGASLHSDPVLLTQRGKLEVKKNADTGKMETVSTGRQDYVLFGTTQGVVQIVDAKTGVEKFVFAPKEVIENQSETFRNKGGRLIGGKTALYYGMDGEWIAHSIYVTDTDGTLTVGKVQRPNYGSSTENQTVSGHQWAYGGMRMGGRSYYALDLSDIEKPNLKFHIEPNSGKIYSYDSASKTMTTKNYNDVTQMGQSWSKPVLGYVNWKGARKLVMFIGGGYDAGGTNGDGLYVNDIRTGYAGYEEYNYKQTNGIGSGVYMFDAENGDLLWKASATNAKDTNVKYLTQPDLKYSVVSSIHTVDRNNDGIVDHLYFGDLAGQAFRVDFANDAKPTNSDFTSQVTKILNVNKVDGTSPRFYLPPTFTAHSNAGKPNGANIVMAIFASGDKSSPLLGTVDSPIKKNTIGLDYNGVYAVYDHDAYNNNGGKYPYFTSSTPLKQAKTLAVSNATPAVGTLKYMNDATTGASTNEWGGWYYHLKNKMDGTSVGVNGVGAGIIKVLKPLIAMENNLYVSQFDPTDNGTTTSCGAGVKGHTFATRLCLPQGICTDGAKYIYNLGPGDVKLNVGPGRSTGTRELVIPDPTNAGGNAGQICTGSGCGGGFIPAGGAIKFIPNKWYEKYSRTGNGG